MHFSILHGSYSYVLECAAASSMVPEVPEQTEAVQSKMIPEFNSLSMHQPFNRPSRLSTYTAMRCCL